MIRLKIMPLVLDFGEILDHPLGLLHPMTQLVFTRDYRIFGQFVHFPDTAEYAPHPRHVQVSELPAGLKVVVVEEGRKTRHTRKDGMEQDMVVVSAGQLKTLVMPDDTSPTNKAIKAYVDQLSNETPVIMGWL